MRFVRDKDNNHCIIDNEAKSDLSRKFWAWTFDEQVADDTLRRLNGMDEEIKRLKGLKNIGNIYTKLKEKEGECIRTGFLTCKVPKNCKHKHGCRDNYSRNSYNHGRIQMIKEILEIIEEEYDNRNWEENK